MPDIQAIVSELRQQIIGFRRDLHQIPETAYNEEKTSSYVAECLTRAGIPVQTGIAEYGLLGLLDSGRPGPCLLIRADMDALPVQEATGLPFASKHQGRMHACGHDGHMAMALGTALALDRIKDSLRGCIKFLFQPAEEGPGGAKPMIEAGVMDNPGVDYSLGCHLWPDIPEGSIGVRPGPFMAAMDRFDIQIIGQGGHGAMPHLCVDALEVGTQVVGGLQRLVSRKLDPLGPAVVTVGTFQAGTAFNVIPGLAELSGTTRTFDPRVWETWEERLEEVISGICRSMGAEYSLCFTPGYPVTINDQSVAEVVAGCAGRVVGRDQVVVPAQTMGGEDFAFFLERSKGCFFAVGVGREGGASVHNPQFDFNEDMLLLGAETFCQAAFELLGVRD
ncbi:MAG: amidohydrolase [Desulfohalobiaceae bacterium]|nr:amidohydrolase [Desulfohalobiaceae bacterium]